jgi:hypothetical protein
MGHDLQNISTGLNSTKQYKIEQHMTKFKVFVQIFGGQKVILVF